MTRRWPLALALLSALACAPGGSGAGGTPSRPVPRSGAEPVQPEDVDAGTRLAAFRAAPATHYTILSLDSVITEYPDGATRVQRHLRGAEVTLRSTQMENGRIKVDIALDTLWMDSLALATPALLDSARGTHWSGEMTPDGHFFSMESDRASTFGDHFLTVFARLFPVLPEDGATPENSWQDSTSRTYSLLPALEAQESLTADYRAVAWEGRDSTLALRIESSRDYSVEGTGSQFGQQMILSGGGVATGQHVLGMDGRLVRADVSDSARLIITLPEVGQTVPLTVRGHYSLQRLP